MAYESDVAGTLTEILAQEGETLPIGAPIAVVGERDEAPEGDGKGPGSAAAGPAADATPTVPAAGGGSAPRGAPASAPPAGEEPGAPGRVKASPLARRVARDKGLDLASLSGSGPGGRIVKADVEAAEQPSTVGVIGAPGPAPETAKGVITRREPTRLQQVVARRMAESKATAPHFYLRAEVDMSAAVAARGRLKAMTPEGEVVPSFNDLVVKACALALREHPLANGSYRDGGFELHSRVNVGVAVAADEALVVPTVFDADKKGLREIAVETRDLAARVREGRVTPPELSGGTFTVSNLGMYGVSGFSAVINPPQAAILAVGEIAGRPVVRDGGVTAAHLMGVTLACDHRILHGAPAAVFLARIRALLEEPLGLAL
jgi:pyruvate dehydrogenase E2 component (dihydrolipoamide acetyltransferase)